MFLGGGDFKPLVGVFLDESEFLRIDDGVFFTVPVAGVLQGVQSLSFAGVLQGVHSLSFAGVLQAEGVRLHGSSNAGVLGAAGVFLQLEAGVLHGVFLHESLGILQLDAGVLQLEGVLLQVPLNGVLTGVFLAHPGVFLLLLQTVALLVTFTFDVPLQSSGSDECPSRVLESSESESDRLVKEKYDDIQLILKSDPIKFG